MLEKLAERFGAAPTIACVIVFGILLSLVVILLMSKLEYFLKRIWRSEITVGARSIRLCSVPLTGLVAVSPAAAFFLSKSGYPDLFIFLSLLLPIALTIIWSVFTCGMRGVWVGVVRILLGIYIFCCCNRHFLYNWRRSNIFSYSWRIQDRPGTNTARV